MVTEAKTMALQRAASPLGHPVGGPAGLCALHSDDTSSFEELVAVVVE